MGYVDEGVDDGLGDDGAAEEALAAGAAAGAASDLFGAEAVSAPSLWPAAAPSPLLAAGFAEEYRSLYQPEPLNWMAGAVSVRSRVPPQCGQVVSSGSENFWIFSVRRWHCWHWYS